MWAKCLNAGQVCVNVDYLFLPEDKTDEFVDSARRLVAARYPDLNSSDYTSIINQRAYDRLTAMLQDAGEKGSQSGEPRSRPEAGGSPAQVVAAYHSRRQ